MTEFTLPDPEILTIGDMMLDMERGRLWKDKRSTKVMRNTATMLRAFGKYPGRVFSDERLRVLLYGDEARCEEIIRANIHFCRVALRRVRSICKVSTVHGYGWEFLMP